MLDNPKINTGSLTECDPHERRRHERYPFTSAVEVVVRESQTRIQGRTSDLSRGGCFVDTTSAFPAGSTVTMRLTKDNRTFEADAEVVYSLAGMGMGVKFTSADTEQLGTVEKWMAELSGEVLPEPELPRSLDQPCAQGRLGNEEYLVLNELVMELMKQGVLSNAKCKAMLQKLNHTGQAKSSSVLV
jgi:hypothetical protein